MPYKNSEYEIKGRNCCAPVRWQKKKRAAISSSKDGVCYSMYSLVGTTERRRAEIQDVKSVIQLNAGDRGVPACGRQHRRLEIWHQRERERFMPLSFESLTNHADLFHLVETVHN